MISTEGLTYCRADQMLSLEMFIPSKSHNGHNNGPLQWFLLFPFLCVWLPLTVGVQILVLKTRMRYVYLKRLTLVRARSTDVLYDPMIHISEFPEMCVTDKKYWSNLVLFCSILFCKEQEMHLISVPWNTKLSLRLLSGHSYLPCVSRDPHPTPMRSMSW